MKDVMRSALRIATKLGYNEPEDLLFHFPRRYEDRKRWGNPFLMKEGEEVTVCGEILSQKINRWGKRRSSLQIFLQLEGSIQAIDLTWFNMPFLQKNLTVGRKLIAHGKIVSGTRGTQLIHPEFELLKEGEDENIHLNRITPIYPSTEGITQRQLRRCLWNLLQLEETTVPELYPAPPEFMGRAEALRSIHFPKDENGRRQARKRLALDELLLMEITIVSRRIRVKTATKQRPAKKYNFVSAFLERLPFQPTSAQKKVCQEIDEDLKHPQPMNRLLQGDVGSGKTIVAIAALLRSLEHGYNGAFMAPTEILATQHYLFLKEMLTPLEIQIELCTRTVKPPSDNLFAGQPTIYVGTHALFQDKAHIPRLGLGVIDEQHKFGVLQRTAFLKKGEIPDLLVMTATPIPRTLCLTLYGDLDVSVIDAAPKGRKPIKTVTRKRTDLTRVWNFIKEEILHGRQAYVVYPLVEDSEKLDLKSVQQGFEELQETFGKHVVGMVHGRLDPEKKAEIMERFRSGELKVLTATSVIEVGVDIPAATMMVIENAERFGLAQLHQLRGRVGRGSQQSYCVLVGDPKNEEGWQRLQIMEKTSDGFELAEEDFKIRGPGNILGTAQSGLPPLRAARLPQDLPLVHQARKIAEEILAKDPTLMETDGLKTALEQVETRVKFQHVVAN